MVELSAMTPLNPVAALSRRCPSSDHDDAVGGGVVLVPPVPEPGSVVGAVGDPPPPPPLHATSVPANATARVSRFIATHDTAEPATIIFR